MSTFIIGNNRLSLSK